MIAAVMTEFKFVCPAAHCKAEDLMPETDSKDRLPANELFGILDAIGDCLRVSRAIAQDYPVRIHVKHYFYRRLSRNNGNIKACIYEIPQDVEFNTEVIDDNLTPPLPPLGKGGMGGESFVPFPCPFIPHIYLF